MKRIKIMLMAAALLSSAQLQTSCTDYQDEIDALEYRVTVLENLVKQVNTDLQALTVIVNAIEQGDYITNVSQTADGYLVNFHKAGPIQIIDGKDGKDGQDGQTPDISVEQDPADGQWYWVINGQWLIIDGQKIQANGKDGKDGKDGQDAVSPQVRINADGIWEISVDGGQTWVSTGTSAVGKDGKDGRDGRDGQDGKDGKNGNQFFMSVTYEVNGEGEFMVITTNSGQQFRIPIYQNH